MRTTRRIRNRSAILLLRSFIRKWLAVGMLWKVYRLRYTLIKAYHVVLPVTHVAAELPSQHSISLVVGPEIKIKDIGDPRSFINSYDNARDRVVCFALFVWFNAKEPFRIWGYAIPWCQPDVRPILRAKCVQCVQVVQRQRRRYILNRFPIGCGDRVCDLRRNVRRKILVRPEQPDKWCWKSRSVLCVLISRRKAECHGECLTMLQCKVRKPRSLVLNHGIIFSTISKPDTWKNWLMGP